jgi:esterase/lipase
MKRTVRLITVIFIAFAVTAPGCNDLPQRLKPSGKNTGFNFDRSTSIGDYIEQSRKMIASSRTDLTPKNRDKVIDANSPFFLTPDAFGYTKNAAGRYKKGILLIHGLSDSPYFLRPVARHLQSKGFAVFGLLLPGHGTVPGDLTGVRYEEWIKAVDFGMKKLAEQAGDLYIGGFSTGGTLSVHYALKKGGVKGLVMFAPCMQAKSGLIWLAGTMKHLKDYESMEDDLDYAKYQSFTFNGASQVYYLTQEVDRLFTKKNMRLSAPAFSVLSIDDTTVESQKTIYDYDNFFTSPLNRMVLYTTTPSVDYDGDKNYCIAEMSAIESEKIISFSHICTSIPPDDPHYGRDGDYRYCLQYDRADTADRTACGQNKNIWFGETTEEIMKKYPMMARLTWKPRFNALMKHLDAFLEAAGK